MLVSAAAGSGKTSVLSERCARLVCDGAAGCGVENLLVLTFTEAAANEMKTRIAAAIQERLSAARSADRRRLLRQAAMIDRAAICTLDAFCGRILRQHFHEAQVDPAFDIIAEDEARLLREDVLDDVLARWHKKSDPDEKAFADFYEAYAQGRDSSCREFILDLHRMLATTADPAAYIRSARMKYANIAGGAVATFDGFLQHTLLKRMRLAEAFASRAAARVAKFTGTGAMRAALLEARNGIKEAADLIEADGREGWPAARRSLEQAELPRCKKVDGIPNFPRLKEETWYAANERIRALIASLGREPGILQKELFALARPLDALLALTDDFSSAYAAAKRTENRLDFADLERLALNLLQAPESAAVADLRSRYHYLLVDEFQDINPLQEALLEKLRCPLRFNNSGNLFVVGDVKQSIYGFRLAEPGLFLAREERLRKASGGKAFITLPHNFRSRPALLSAMNGVFERLLTPEVAGIQYTDGHALQPGSAGSEGAASPVPIEVHLVTMKNNDEKPEEDEDVEEPQKGQAPESIDDPPQGKEILSPYDHEARMVADRIADLLAENRLIANPNGTTRPLARGDIAILLRTMKNRAAIFVRALARRGIPVHADLSAGFFDSPEIKDALALLRTLDNPQQDIPLATALLGPFGHFSRDDLARIRLAFDDKEVPFAIAAAHYAAISQGGTELPALAKNAPPPSSDLAARLQIFFESLARWRELLRSRPLHEALAAIFDEAKVFTYLSGLDAPAQRIANLQMLGHKALAFASFRRQGLHRFLRFIERLSDDDAGGGEAPVLSEASDVVRIMSIHKSKGLEFPIVFVSGLGGKKNDDRAAMIQLHRDLGIGLATVDVPANVYYPSALSERINDDARRSRCAEELRLLYVALTRAAGQLFLTGHVNAADKIDACRFEWQGHAGPLPEDHLLRATTPLDWLLPALAAASSKNSGGTSLHVSWNGAAPFGEADVSLFLHPADASGGSVADAAESPDHALAELFADPPSAPGAIPEETTRLLARVMATYPNAALTRQPAVQTVTFLKSQSPQMAEPEEAPPVLAESLAEVSVDTADREARQEAARLRGIATHRILELLDFTDCATPGAIDAQIEAFLQSGKLDPDQAGAADRTGIAWFLTASAAGRRLRDAAGRIAAGDRTLTILRELPFTWTGSLQVENQKSKIENLSDAPTIRGVIDLLLIERVPDAPPTAEILDYKTDSTFTWQQNQEAYRRQMHYYLQSAGDILRFPVSKATLIFLSPKAEIVVALP